MALGFLQSECACWSKSTKIILTKWNQINVEQQFIILVKHLFVGFICAHTHKKKRGIELQKLKAMQNLKDYHPGLAADFALEKKNWDQECQHHWNNINFVINWTKGEFESR